MNDPDPGFKEAIETVRAIIGEEYTRGWLDAALAELDGPPIIELRKPQ